MLVFLLLFRFAVTAQCPNNIDFEQGNFAGWQCFIGSIENNIGNIFLTTSGPTSDRHVMYKAGTTETDYWGGFPVVCPNGSDYSIRLGNESSGRGAERVSYKFTIPAGQNDFSLIYNYAIVLEDPGHASFEQPRLSIEVLNLSDNITESCSSFDFVAFGAIPGFKLSPFEHSGTPVRYKDWSAAFINLNGKAGKTFIISFTTTDCSRGAHFGYAYIDVNAGCSSVVPGALYCFDDDFVELSAPPGFKTYKWFNTSNTILGTDPVLKLSPPPPAGDTAFVEFTPYNGYGCVDTLTILLNDTLTITAKAGADSVFCANPAIRLGAPPKYGEVYRWEPTTGLSDPKAANPVASPGNSTQYILYVENKGGGCKTSDTVKLVKRCDVIEFFVPGAFTPNGDGVNDRLRPVLYGYSRLNYFSVYNRLGQVLYSASGYNVPGWDGTIKGKPAGMQTVVWMVEAVDAYERVVRRQGTAVLLR